MIGTLVRDTIRHPSAGVIEQWGGLTYSLAALSAGKPAGWEVRPILRVGADLAESAWNFIGQLPGLELDCGFTVVPEPNNRVELCYRDTAERSEQLSGGVCGWTFAELEPLLKDVDAVYVNFISGFEMDITTAESIRTPGIPVYADLHSLFLGPPPADGPREPRVPDEWRRWIAAFDIVQMNEPELALLSAEAGLPSDGDPLTALSTLAAGGPKLAFLTRGPQGAVWALPGEAGKGGYLPLAEPPSSGDPTGCGDIWGAIVASGLAAGEPVELAMRRANTAASARLGVTGITRLRDALYHALHER
ncbi:MAG: carbohydrate kinase family protein [Gemmatimonadota bacterium]|nr:carbohydrate kinase family protein [Gemmatimonadota bacterium]